MPHSSTDTTDFIYMYVQREIGYRHTLCSVKLLAYKYFVIVIVMNVVLSAAIKCGETSSSVY